MCLIVPSSHRVCIIGSANAPPLMYRYFVLCARILNPEGFADKDSEIALVASLKVRPCGGTYSLLTSPPLPSPPLFVA